MNVFSLKMNLNSNVNQAELMQFLKSQNAEVIQTSDGLCVKTEKNQTELSQILKDKNASDVAVQSLDSQSEELSADVKAFIGKEGFNRDSLM